MNKTLKIMGQLAIMAAVCAVGSAFAQDIFDTAAGKLGNLFRNVRMIVFILGGFALVGFAIMAIFGKLQWTKVAILAVGLALLAVAGQVVEYAVNKGDGSEMSKGISDTISDYEGG